MKKVGESVRDFVNEWSINILILLFGTTTLVQAFIVPTPSMDTTVMVGDHLLVDKLSYAPAGSITRHFLPYTEVQRGDIIVFRYPIDIRQNYVKRCIGRAGDWFGGGGSSWLLVTLRFSAGRLLKLKTTTLIAINNIAAMAAIQ